MDVWSCIFKFFRARNYVRCALHFPYSHPLLASQLIISTISFVHRICISAVPHTWTHVMSCPCRSVGLSCPVWVRVSFFWSMSGHETPHWTTRMVGRSGCHFMPRWTRRSVVVHGGRAPRLGAECVCVCVQLLIPLIARVWIQVLIIVERAVRCVCNFSCECLCFVLVFMLVSVCV